MKKILLIHNKYRFFGGEDQSVENEIQLLNKYYDLRVIFESNYFTNIFNDLIAMIFGKNFNFEKKLNDHINDFSPDFIYVHNTWYKTSLSFLKTLQKKKIPVVIKLHNLRYYCTKTFSHNKHMNGESICKACGMEKSKKVFNKYFNDSYFKSFFVIKYGKKYINILKNFDNSILVLTDFHKKFLINEGVNENKIFIIPNYLSLNKAFPKKQKSDYFVYAGRISVEKGVDCLVSSFKNASLKNTSLKLIGEGPLLSKLKNDYKNDINIKFLGSLENKVVLKEINGSKGVITATRLYEGQPTLLCEASKLGKVSIFPKTGGIVDFFPENYNFAFSQFNYLELKEKIKILDKKSEDVNIGLENKKHIDKLLDEKAILESFKKVFVEKNE